MNRSDIFKTAHRIAKADRWIGQKYSDALAIALRRIYKRIRTEHLIEKRQRLATEFQNIADKYWEGEATDEDYTAAQIAVENVREEINFA